MSMSVTTDWIEIAPGFAGYLALPPSGSGPGSGPGLVLFQEIFGVNAHIRAVAEQYAQDGFVVLAPDLFWRAAPRVALGYDGADRQQAMQLMQAYDGGQAQADIAAAVGALRVRSEVAGAKVGAVGYCLGGRLAYVAAATAGVDAASAYYGGGIQNQLDLATAISCPVQFHYGANDDHIPADAVGKVRQTMARKGADVFVYPGAGHGFNCWARSSYHAPSAALAHGRTLTFLANSLF